MSFSNAYEDISRARAYATLEFANTYYLAYRDLPAIIGEHVSGTKAIDFGCGTGRSTRFLRQLGFDIIGTDISEDMLCIARSADPAGDYRLIPGDDFSQFDAASFDLVLSVFTFDNIPGEAKGRIFRDLASLMKSNGTLISVVSSPEIYTHEWASFTTRDFPANKLARSGDPAQIIVTDHQDQRPVIDIVCTDSSYRELYSDAGLRPISMYKPLARGSEAYHWVSETGINPWVIYVLKKTD